MNLRKRLADVGDTINFNATLTGATGNTIDLLSTLTITQNNLTIDGTGSGPITVDGQSTVRGFIVDGAGDAITALTIARASAAPGTDVNSEGGAIAIDPNGTSLGAGLAVTNCTFSSNSANEGSAIYNNGAMLTVTTCTFTDNSSSNDGAIFRPFNDVSTMTVTGSSFTDNTAGNDGAAIFNSADFPLLITNCAFTHNIANGNDAGAVYSDEGALTVDNCTFTNNSVPHEGDGGAVYSGGTALTVCNLHFLGQFSRPLTLW